jgi:hypothetical protein
VKIGRLTFLLLLRLVVLEDGGVFVGTFRSICALTCLSEVDVVIS